MKDTEQIKTDTTVTANYTANTYTITINGGRGASGSPKTYTVTYGQKWTVPSCPFSRSGYTFSGYTGGYSVGQSITVTGNISMTCNWTVVSYSGKTVSLKYWAQQGGDFAIQINSFDRALNGKTLEYAFSAGKIVFNNSLVLSSSIIGEKTTTASIALFTGARQFKVNLKGYSVKTYPATSASGSAITYTV